MSLTVVFEVFFTALPVFCRQLLLFSLAGPFVVCCSPHQWFVSLSEQSKLLYWLGSMFVLCLSLFLPLIRFKVAYFSLIESYLVFKVALSFYNIKMSLQVNPSPKPRVLI